MWLEHGEQGKVVEDEVGEAAGGGGVEGQGRQISRGLLGQGKDIVSDPKRERE